MILVRWFVLWFGKELLCLLSLTAMVIKWVLVLQKEYRFELTNYV